MDDARFVRVNPAWTTALGWAEEELTGTPLLDFLHPDDVEATRPAWADVCAGNALLNFENRYRAKDGSFHWLSWVCVPENGKLYSSARDITAEKEQTTALAQSRADRDRMWRNSQDVITGIDMTGYIRSVNPAATAWLGWSADEMVGRSCMTFIHPDDHPPLDGGLFIAERYAEPRVFRNRFRHKDGSYRSIAWLSVLSDGYIYSSGRDVTVEMEQAAALQTAEEQLRQSQKMEAVGQ